MDILTPVVIPEVRKSISRVPSWTNVLAHPGAVVLGGSIGGTITGWGSPVGSPMGFRRVSFPMRCSVSGYVPTQVRVRVRESDYNGTVLADKTSTVALSLNTEKEVTVTFDSAVANAGGAQLWVEILTDGRIDEYRISPTAYATPAARYWTDASISSPNASPLAAASQRNYPVTFKTEDEDSLVLSLSVEMSKLVDEQTVLSRIVIPTYGVDITASVGVRTSSAMASSSNFSGWGAGVGSISEANAFNSASFFLYPFSESEIPTQCRVIVRRLPSNTANWADNPATWEIIADTTFPVSPVYNTFSKVTARFGTDVRLFGDLYVEYMTNGKDGGMVATGNLATGLTPHPPSRWYVTSQSITSGAWVAAVSNVNWYIELGLESFEIAGFDVTEEFKSKLTTVPSAESVVIHMPTTLYALEGREFNVYFDNIIRSSANIDSLLIDVTCVKGSQFGSFGGYWRYTPTAGDAGSTTFEITASDKENGNTLATATATLVTKALSHPSTPVSRNLLCIGDSTLGGGGAAVLAELVNLFNGDSQYSLTLQGSNNGNVNDSGAVSRAVSCDAISGWTVAMFYTDTSTAWTEIGGTSRTGSPFVFTGAFDFTTYRSTHSVTLASGDWVLIHLGINDIFGILNDSNLQAKVEVMISQLEAMVTNIRASVSGIRIAICTTIPPNGSQDGFGADYTSGQTRIRYKRNRDLWVERILTQFRARTAENIHLISYGSAIDTVNNFGLSSVAYNARNSGTYNRSATGSGVHPSTSGYYQLADSIRSFLKAVES